MFSVSAENRTMIGGGWNTLMVTCADTVPKGFEAVMVYVVVCCSVTSSVPTRLTDPTFGAMLICVAFSTCQTSVETPPGGMLSGEAEKRTMRGPVPGTT